MKWARCWPLLLCLACRNAEQKPVPSVASAAARPGSATLLAVQQAEYTRRPSAIPKQAYSDADVITRRAAARALARNSEPQHIEQLLELLADADARVVSYAAFGLGRSCAGRESELTAAISLRVATFLNDGKSDEPTPFPAFANALAACGGDAAERSLRAWLALSSELASPAALALGFLAGRQGRLDDSSFVALLDLAAKNPAISSSLYAFSRLAPAPGALRDHAVEQAKSCLSRPAPARTFALHALGRMGAVDELSSLLTREDWSDVELAQAARELSQHGARGQALLSTALAQRVTGEEAARKVAQGRGVSSLLALLETLSSPTETARAALTQLAQLDVPNPAMERRRVVLLRCTAARLLADANVSEPKLGACDPEPGGRRGKLALLWVLNRGKLTGARGKQLQELGRDSDSVVRQAALRLIPAHRELENTGALLAEALDAAAPGVVTAAAEILATHPERSNDARGDTHPEQLVNALVRALRAERFVNNPITRSALVDAAAALGVLSLVDDIQRLCQTPNTTLRSHAERALAALRKSPGTRCTAVAETPPPSELGRLVTSKVRLSFETEMGQLKLELDPSEAPLAVTRIVELARAGFYDGTAVHRLVPGFIVQFGDPGGDGYGVAAAPPLPAEFGPWPLEAAAVAIAQGGADTGSSQLFVALGRSPHLDGDATFIGRATSGWEQLAPGDRILRVRVEP